MQSANDEVFNANVDRKLKIFEAHCFDNPFPFDVRCRCPKCLSLVSWEDFLFCYRFIELTHPPAYDVVTVCRKCRDAGALDALFLNGSLFNKPF